METRENLSEKEKGEDVTRLVDVKTAVERFCQLVSTVTESTTISYDFPNNSSKLKEMFEGDLAMTFPIFWLRQKSSSQEERIFAAATGIATHSTDNVVREQKWTHMYISKLCQKELLTC